MDDDLAPSKTEGFKVGEKKTIDEYKNLGRTSSIPISLRRPELPRTWIGKAPCFSYLGGSGISIVLCESSSFQSSSYPKSHISAMTTFSNYLLTLRLPYFSNHRKIDQADEALNRWKASLGIGTGTAIANPSDPRRCVIKSLALV
jgi:hypothetical protein